MTVVTARARRAGPVTALRALDRALLAPVPRRRLAALRLLVCGYAVVFLLARLPGLLQVIDLPAERFHPVGALWWAPGPLPPLPARLALAATVAVGVAALAGWRWRVTGPVFAAAFLAVATYRVSFGHVLHTDHLPAVHLLVLAAAPAAGAAWSLDARAGRGAASPTHGPEGPAGTAAGPEGTASGWPVRVMALATVVAYVLAGLAKLRYGGTAWLSGEALRTQVAYDNLRKELLGDIHSPLGGWLVGVPAVWGPLALVGVGVELAAPVVALGGRARRWWALSAWGFHVGVVALMAISFPYQLAGVAYAPLFACERLFERAGAAARRARARRWPGPGGPATVTSGGGPG